MIRIILLGYMGSGKTTIGKALAQELGVQFYDLDWYIKTRYRKGVEEIFAERGEEGFRDLERRMLHEVTEFEDVVISCGGGTPCFFDNMAYMNTMADTVYLQCTPEVLVQHIKMGKGIRPLLQGKNDEELYAYICTSLADRMQYYTQAKYTLDVTLLENFTRINETVALLRNLLKI